MSYRSWGLEGLDDPRSDAPGSDRAIAPGKRTLTMSISRSPVQRKAEAAPTGEPASLPAPGGGAELPAPVREKMEHAFGVELSQVRVHEGPHVSSVQALAYTQGTDIHFAPGQYQPHSDAGQFLLGHELTHVVQQAQGRVAATTQAHQVGLNDDAGLEREADEMGARAARGERVPMSGSGSAPSAGARAPLQRFGLGAQLDQLSESVARAQATRWATPMQTAAELQQARQSVTAAPAGGPFALDDHASGPGQCRSVLMTDILRRALLDALRRRTMTRVVEVRAPFRPRLEAEHDAAGRRTIQDELRTAARPFLDELRAHPGARYDGDEATQREVLAAIELDAEGNAETDLASQTAHGAAGPRDHARDVGGLSHGPWCGAFCYTTHRGAGLTEQARGAMQSTGPHRGVDAFLDYENRRQVIWSGTAWMLVHDYHAQRNSLRVLHRVPPPAPGASTDFPTGLGIQPGDVVLIDNARGEYADHITQCRTYDPSTGHLETIGGNEGGGEGRIGASAQSHRNRPIDIVADGVRKQPRVYGYGRFSIVDYEQHHYLPSMPADPHESPEAMAARPRRRR